MQVVGVLANEHDDVSEVSLGELVSTGGCVIDVAVINGFDDGRGA